MSGSARRSNSRIENIGNYSEMGADLCLGPAILRTANWPIETVDALNSPSLSRMIDKWLSEEQAIRHDGLKLNKRIYKVIPAICDKKMRHKLLALRRHIYACADAIPNEVLQAVLASQSVPTHLRKRISLHAESRIRLKNDREQLIIEYGRSLESERRELRRIVGDLRFKKALYLASPATVGALSSAAVRLSDQKMRRLEATLFSYLMRSVGRATPNGLWAGVALEDHCHSEGRPIYSEAAEPGISFNPDLSIFMTIVREMVRRHPWREEMPLRLNPTIFRAAHGDWQFGSFQDGLWRELVMKNDRTSAGILGTLSDLKAKIWPEIRKSLVERFSILAELDADRMIAQLLDCGILWPSVELPGIYSDAWQALHMVIAQLPEQEKIHWSLCIGNLRTVCLRLSADYITMSLPDWQECLVEAREHVNALRGHYGLGPVPSHKQVVIGDSRAAFRFSIAKPIRAAIARALCDYDDFDWFGLGEAQAIRERTCEYYRLLSASPLPLMEFLRGSDAEGHASRSITLAEEGKDGSIPKPRSVENKVRWSPLDIDSAGNRVHQAFQRWYGELQHTHVNRRHELGTSSRSKPRACRSPGSALLRLEIGHTNVGIRIGSVTPDPCLFYSRFHSVLSAGYADADNFGRWYRDGLAAIEARFPTLRFTDLAVRVEANPNAACRPRMTERVIDPLAPMNALGSASIELGSDYRARMFTDDGMYFLPRLHSAVSLEAADCYSQRLHRVAYLLGRTILMRPFPELPLEAENWGHLPRLCLAGGVVFSPERWMPARTMTQQISALSGVDRFIAWRRYVREARLPRFVYGKSGQYQTEMLMCTDSLLAVETFFRVSRPLDDSVQFQEVYPNPTNSWVRDEEGRHHVAEIAVSWEGDAAFWETYLSAVDGSNADLAMDWENAG